MRSNKPNPPFVRHSSGRCKRSRGGSRTAPTGADISPDVGDTLRRRYERQLPVAIGTGSQAGVHTKHRRRLGASLVRCQRFPRSGSARSQSKLTLTVSKIIYRWPDPSDFYDGRNLSGTSLPDSLIHSSSPLGATRQSQADDQAVSSYSCLGHHPRQGLATQTLEAAVEAQNDAGQSRSRNLLGKSRPFEEAFIVCLESRVTLDGVAGTDQPMERDKPGDFEHGDSLPDQPWTPP